MSAPPIERQSPLEIFKSELETQGKDVQVRESEDKEGTRYLFVDFGKDYRSKNKFTAFGLSPPDSILVQCPGEKTWRYYTSKDLGVGFFAERKWQKSLSVTAQTVRSFLNTNQITADTHPVSGVSFCSAKIGTDKDFEKLIGSSKRVVVEFYDSCGHKDPKDLQKIAWGHGQDQWIQLDADQNPKSAAKYGVTKFPSVIVFQEGKIIFREKE